MADSMNLSVTAEGVETASQLEFLRNRQCDEVQGYYLSRPLPSGAAEKFLDKDRSSAGASDAGVTEIRPAGRG